jgi:hypothetical protein
MSSTDGTRKPAGEPPRDGGAIEAADFLKMAIADLACVARRHRHDMLGYLLDMAHMEAEEIVRRGASHDRAQG